jgi:hypothetical protein
MIDRSKDFRKDPRHGLWIYTISFIVCITFLLILIDIIL